MLDESGGKPKKIWVDKDSEFYNRSVKLWLQDYYTEIYSTYNEGKSVVAERFITTLKSKIYKNMNSISTNIYIGKLQYIIDKYNNTYHRIIKMKPIDVRTSTYINFNFANNDKDPTFKLGVHVRL